ncbi:MAG: DUF1254 domain-containing protein [Zhengella sp.]|uniref:DUF1254 domain-containing protein n=1 Tax=Zhengella sp. TaxID=2282762 RepID=UPI001DBF2AC5|nr:DUF1254 domain-containing protein [Notoacmeibacter sp.]MCC0026344.1 DUF1254 domain-containing protein [Brucellaceae bacterium]
MGRLFHAIALGLAGAGIVHIAALLLVPHFASNDAWSRIAALGPEHDFALVEPAGRSSSGVIEVHDPEFAIAACRFDLGGGPVHVTAELDLRFWSVSIFNDRGQSIYSFNDRNSSSGALDLAIATPVQMVELRKDLPDAFADSIFVEADLSRGMVVLRLFEPDPGNRQAASAMLDGAACAPYPLQ